ncbi:MAG TPA: hypothetical protein VHT70_01320 [Candidatus Saccharimonadales bacterium]|nr:hypothetical protein [Candidatus Saccharimonadales bacterium]
MAENVGFIELVQGYAEGTGAVKLAPTHLGEVMMVAAVTPSDSIGVVRATRVAQTDLEDKYAPRMAYHIIQEHANEHGHHAHFYNVFSAEDATAVHETEDYVQIQVAGETLIVPRYESGTTPMLGTTALAPLAVPDEALVGHPAAALSPVAA